jgi:pimeloyl-ACP methyl ester carboxylesterase
VTTDLRIDRGDGTLAASYSPAGETAIVALHAAGEGTREGLLYERLHEVLLPAGIGVVTFDRRGEGESTGDATRGRFRLQAEDALAVADAVDAKRVGLWGYSQGGWVAPIAAVMSEKVAFLVLVASIGVTPAEQMMYATAEQLRLAGYDESVVEQALDLRRRFEGWVHGRGREREAELRADLLAALDEDWFGHLFLPPVLLDQEGCALWIEEMDFDPREVFAQVRVPTLVFYGEADSWARSRPASRRRVTLAGTRSRSSSSPRPSTSSCVPTARWRPSTSARSWTGSGSSQSTEGERRSRRTVSRQAPQRRAIRSRRPTILNPSRSWSATLAAFSGKMLVWIVQSPAASAPATSASISARPMPRPRALSATYTECSTTPA